MFKTEEPFADVRRLAELVCCCHAPRNRLMAVKLDLSMRRFGQNSDHVLTKRGDQVAQTAAWTGAAGVASVDLSRSVGALNARRRGTAYAWLYRQLAGTSNN